MAVYTKTKTGSTVEMTKEAFKKLRKSLQAKYREATPDEVEAHKAKIEKVKARDENRAKKQEAIDSRKKGKKAPAKKTTENTGTSEEAESEATDSEG